jgi:hypothetical protein
MNRFKQIFRSSPEYGNISNFEKLKNEIKKEIRFENMICNDFFHMNESQLNPEMCYDCMNKYNLFKDAMKCMSCQINKDRTLKVIKKKALEECVKKK